MDFESLPFPIVEDVESVVRLMGSDISVPADFIEEFCSRGAFDSCEKIFSLMVTGESDAYELKKHTQSEKLCILYAGNLVPSSYRALKAYVDDNPDYNYVITYRRAISPANKSKFDSLVGDANIYGLLTAYQYTVKEIISYAFACLTGEFKSKKLNIVVLILLVGVLVNAVAMSIVSNMDEKSLQKELTTEIEEAITNFKDGAEGVTDVTYEITVHSWNSADVDVYITTNGEAKINSYTWFDLRLFSYDSMMSGYTLVSFSCDVYRNGEKKASYYPITVESKSDREKEEEAKEFKDFYDAYQDAKDDYYN
jgi:hypothetical protein